VYYRTTLSRPKELFFVVGGALPTHAPDDDVTTSVASAIAIPEEVFSQSRADDVS